MNYKVFTYYYLYHYNYSYHFTTTTTAGRTISELNQDLSCVFLSFSDINDLFGLF